MRALRLNRGVAGVLAAAATASFAVAAAVPARAATAAITEFGGLTNGALFLTPGPDGTLWFTEPSAGKVGHITVSGTVTEFGAGTGVAPVDITAGPDGNLWFTASGSKPISRVTPSGAVTPVPVAPSGSPFGIVAGPDGNLWFTEATSNHIGRLTPGGVLTEFALPTGGSAAAIAVGPDHNLWFADAGRNAIGRITLTGVVTEFAVPTLSSSLRGISAGPDGNIWFVEQNANKVGRITPAGTITEFALPAGNPSGGPSGITAARDGNLWVTEALRGKIARIKPSGVITEYPTSAPTTQPWGIAAAADGNVWFTETATAKIARLAIVSTDDVAPDVALTAPSAMFTLSSSTRVSWVASDVLSGVARVQVRYRAAAWNGDFRGWTYPSGWQAVTGSSIVVRHLRSGYDYCFSVRAIDGAGNASAWSAMRCTAVPLDDRSLARSDGWTSVHARHLWNATSTASRQAGARLVRTQARFVRLALVATRCPTCGVVGVYSGRRLIARVNLRYRTTVAHAIFVLPKLSRRSAAITLRVLSSGSLVEIDGLGISRT